MDPEEEASDKIPEADEEAKGWGFLERLAFGAKAAFLGAAATAGLFVYLAHDNYLGHSEKLDGAREEVVREIEIKEEYVRESQEDLLSAQESLMREQEGFMEKQREMEEQEWILKKREVKVNGEKQKLESEKSSVRSEREELECLRREVEADKHSLELKKRRMESEDSLLDTREKIIQKKEKILGDIDSKLSAKVLESADHCLAFTLFYDHNRNYVLDDVDSKISERFLGGISILSQEYVSSVRYIHNPAVLKKLESYGVAGPVLCVNDDTLVFYSGEDIKRIVEDVPEGSLYDFEFSPQGDDGIEKILSNRKTRDVSPVTLFDSEKLGGSGFVLGNNYIATAYHVIDGMGDEFTITFEDGKKIKTSRKSVVAHSEEFDLALIRVEFDRYRPVALREDTGIGHLITLVRAPTNTNIKKGGTARGHIYCSESVSFNSLLNTEEGNDLPVIRGTDSYITTIEAFPGDSGSPAVDWGGDIVGIVTGVYNNKKGSTSIIKTKYLKKLMEQYQKKCE